MFINPAPNTRRRVLVVDDQPDVVHLLKLLLEDAGFHVEEATSGREAIELATSSCGHEFDVVVLDVNMRDVDGVRVAAELRACEGCRRTRIAFHSVLDEDMVRARFAGYDDFLRKPVNGDRMIERIKRLAAAPRSE